MRRSTSHAAFFLLVVCLPALGQQPTGSTTVDGDLTVNGNLTVNGDLIVRGRIITDGSDQDPVKNIPDMFTSLWNLDQQHHGMSVTLRDSGGSWIDPTADVRLDEQGLSLSPNTDSAPNPLITIHNNAKLSADTYTMVKALFDNYNPHESKTEDALGTNPAEDAEIDAFLNAVMQTEVIKQTLSLINSNHLRPEGGVYSEDEFKQSLKHQWFGLYTNHFSNPKPNCSGFEHVFIGDHNGSNIGGHHFWWKYFLDEQAGKADSLGHKYKGPRGQDYRWIATFRMNWIPEPGVSINQPDQKGFFVGCSPELMVAYGTLALLLEKKNDGAHPVIEFDGGKYELTLHASTIAGSGDPDDRRGDQIRSAFPKLLAASSTGPMLDQTVAEALTLPNGQHVRVTGVIVDALNGNFGLQLADVVGSSQSLAVKLPKTFRLQFNVALNPAAKGRKVVIDARRGMYTGISGLVDVTHVEFRDEQ